MSVECPPLWFEPNFCPGESRVAAELESRPVLPSPLPLRPSTDYFIYKMELFRIIQRMLGEEGLVGDTIWLNIVRQLFAQWSNPASADRNIIKNFELACFERQGRRR